MSINEDNGILNFWNEEQVETEWRLKEGERRDVAILFADVHGFTNMSTRHDPEVVHEKIDELMKIFSRCTEYYGGYVDKYVGDCIMSLFGAKVASESDTERAILTGFKMISQLKLYNSLLKTQPQFKEEELSIRIGINTGLVSVGKVGVARDGDFTVYGHTVNLASRLESNAPLNHILVTAQTMQAVKHLFEFERIGFTKLKGIDDQIDAYIVKNVRAELPKRWSISKTPYIGRRTEISSLQKLITEQVRLYNDKLQSNFSNINVSITGDAGMGKSRLLNELVSQQQNYIYLNAIASGVNPVPMNLFTSMLENYLGIHVNQTTEYKKKKIETWVEELCHSIPKNGNESDDDTKLKDDKILTSLQDSLPILSYLLEIHSDDIRLKQKGKDLLIHIQQALLCFIEAVILSAGKQQNIMIISWDDLHWADEATLLTLEFLYNSTIFKKNDLPIPVITFMLYREWDCRQVFFEKMGIKYKIALTPLKDSEVIQLIRQQAGHFELQPKVIDKVKALSDGNPFYLEEWCNLIYNLPANDSRELPVPTNLHALILSRLDKLPEALKLLLQKASVIGQEFFVGILHQIESRLQNNDDTDTLLSKLEDQTLILKMLGFDYSAYFFKHITTREVAYQTLLHVNRKVLHQLTAEAIEDLFPDRLDEFLFALAEHYHKAEINDKAIHFLYKAAAAACKKCENLKAIEYYDRLLKLLPENETNQSTDILLKKAEILWMTGKYNEAESLINQALNKAVQINDDLLCFEALRQRGIAYFYREELEQAKQDFDRCLELAAKNLTSLEKIVPEQVETLAVIKNNELLAIAYNNLGIWYQHIKDNNAAIELFQKSMSYSALLPEKLRYGRTLSNIGLIFNNKGDYNKAIQNFLQYLSIAEINRYLKDESLALGNLGFAYQKQNKPEEAKQHYERKWLLCEKMGDQIELIKVLGNIGNLHRDKNEHREALEYYRKVLRIKEMLGNPKELGITHSVIAVELAALSLHDEALIEIDKAIDYAADYPANLEKYNRIKEEIEQGKNNR